MRPKAPQVNEGGNLSSMLDRGLSESDLVPTPVADLHLRIGEHLTATTHPTRKPQRRKNKLPTEPPVDTAPVPYFDPVTGATGRAVSQMKYGRKVRALRPAPFELVYHEWDWPMRRPNYLQANCVRCHNDVNSTGTKRPMVF